MASVSTSAPALEKQRVDQIAALPIGSRVKLDPWSNRLTMVTANSVGLVAAREKMPFEVTPFSPFLMYSHTDKKLASADPVSLLTPDAGQH
jgi:hypothetical protein